MGYFPPDRLFPLFSKSRVLHITKQYALKGGGVNVRLLNAFVSVLTESPSVPMDP